MKTKVEYQPTMEAYVVSCFVNNTWYAKRAYKYKQQATAIAKDLSKEDQENPTIYFENGQEICEPS